MQDKDINLSDIPEIKQEHLHKAKLRFARKPIQKGKVRVNITLVQNRFLFWTASVQLEK